MSSSRLSQQLGYEFRQPALLRQALTHRSFGATNNERFEFLGDSVLNCVIAQYLFDHYPKLSEGDLSRLRANLVNQQTLSEIADTLELGKLLHLGEGELKSGGQKRPSILADAVEALVAAVYLDAGFDACRTVMAPWFAPLIAALPPPNKVGKDPKTRLQEWLQGRQHPLPVYALLHESGEDHARVFRVSCTLVAPAACTEGEGSSRRAAEQVAASAMLELLESA